MAPGVYSLPGFADSWERKVQAAALAVGPEAVVSQESAGQLHGLSGVPPNRVTLTASRYSHPRAAGAVVHQLSDVLPEHVQQVHGFRATTAARTVVDLAAVQTPGRLAYVLDDAVAARKLTIIEVGACLGSVARRGKPGEEAGPATRPAGARLASSGE